MQPTLPDTIANKMAKWQNLRILQSNKKPQRRVFYYFYLK